MNMATVLVYVAIGAGLVAVLKVICSSRGKVTLPGVSIQWSK